VVDGPVLTSRREAGLDLPLLVWRLSGPVRAIGSAPLGGGLGDRRWLINATVPMSYRRDDPDAHLAALARDLDLVGPGIGLLTGVDVADLVTREEGGIRVWATVGLGTPILAAAPEPAAVPVEPAAVRMPVRPRPSPAPGQEVGTVNIVAWVPVGLSDAALVNAVGTVTEAKAQALWELGLAATGTATDAVVVLCPPDGPREAYGGPRSRWGAPLARATRAAVVARGADPGPAWSVRYVAEVQRAADRHER
jgi:adenosylcobinamide amidohydrolase